MEIGTEISKKIRAAIKTKLEELGAYVDEELPDYIMVMVANKKTKLQMQTDLSLFLGEAANSFTDWLSQLLNKLQNITAETLERQFKAQQKAEKTGQSTSSTKVLLSLEQRKNDDVGGEAGANKKPKVASDQLPPGDYISIQTDDVIEGLEEEEQPPALAKDPPLAKMPSVVKPPAPKTITSAKPSSTNALNAEQSSATTATLKKTEPIHKEPPSLVEARQALDDALRKKRAAEGKVEMPRKLLKTSSSSTAIASKRRKDSSSPTVAPAAGASAGPTGPPKSKAVFVAGSVLKERDVDEHGRIIGSIVKVTDKKGKSLLQSKVIGGSARMSAAASQQQRSLRSSASKSFVAPSAVGLHSQITRGLRSDEMRASTSSSKQPQSDVRRGEKTRIQDVATRDTRDDYLFERATRDTKHARDAIADGAGKVPRDDPHESRMYSDRSAERSLRSRGGEQYQHSKSRERSREKLNNSPQQHQEYDPMTYLKNHHNHHSQSHQHDSSLDAMEPPPRRDPMAPPNDPVKMSPPTARPKLRESRQHRHSNPEASDDVDATTNPVARSRSRSDENSKRAALESSNPAFHLKKDNGKTVTVTRAHLQSFKVHIKNRKRHPSDDYSCAVDDYSVAGGDLERRDESFNTRDNSGWKQNVSSLSTSSRPVPDEPEPYEEDEEEEEYERVERAEHIEVEPKVREEEEEEEQQDEQGGEEDREEVVGDRMSDADLGSPTRYSDVDELRSSPPMQAVVTSFRNVRQKSPSPVDEASGSGDGESSWSPQRHQQQPLFDQRRFQPSRGTKAYDVADAEDYNEDDSGDRHLHQRREKEMVPVYESEEEERKKLTAVKEKHVRLDSETEPEPPGTEARILLPHEQAEEDKRLAKEKRARERAEKKERIRKRKAEKAAAVQAAAEKLAAVEAAKAEAAEMEKAEAAAALAALAAQAAAAKSAQPVKASTEGLKEDLENSNWRDIVSRALRSQTEKEGEPAVVKEPEKPKPKLRRPPPPSTSVHSQPPSTPPRQNQPAPPAAVQESPRFIVTLDGVDSTRFAKEASTTSTSSSSNGAVGNLNDKFANLNEQLPPSNDGVENEEEEEMVTLDGFAEDDIFIYINEDDVEYHPTSSDSAVGSPLHYVPSSQSQPSLPTPSQVITKKQKRVEAVRPKTTRSKKKNVKLPVRRAAAAAAAAGVAGTKKKETAAATTKMTAEAKTAATAADLSTTMSTTQNITAATGKAIASVAPQLNTNADGRNQFTWQNPNVNSGRNNIPPQTNIQSRFNGINRTTTVPDRPLFRKNAVAVPVRQVPPFVAVTPVNAPHSSSDRCRFWPACRAGEGCPFQHPTKSCKAFPKCKFGDKCLFIHPNCKYDATCTKLACPYTHASKRGNLFVKPIVKTVVVAASRNVSFANVDTQMPCRYGNACIKLDCAFTHPRDKRNLKAAAAAADPTEEMSTEMAERILNFPTKLFWKK